MAKRVTIINFKGGVGKTTLSFHLATGLARYHSGARVLLVDIDHQSSLSVVCLGGVRWQETSRENQNINQVFRHFTDSSSQLPNEEIILKNPLHGKYRAGSLRHDYASLDLVPSTLDLDDTEIGLASTHLGNPIASEWDKRTLICRWLEEANIDQNYDYVIFDCPPATKIVSQNAIAASHGYIVPVVPEAVMQLGTPHLISMIETGIDRRIDALQGFGNPRSMYVSPTALIGIVITRIKTSGSDSGYTNDHTQQLESLQQIWGNKLIRPYIKDGVGVSECLTAGIPVYDRSSYQNVGRRGFPEMFINLVGELKQRIDAL